MLCGRLLPRSAAALLIITGIAVAQESRITARIDNSKRITLAGHMTPRARAANDTGRVSPSLMLERVTLTFAPSASQKAALDQLLAEQQDPASPNYHHWLTPEVYGQRFGASDADIAKISAWLQSQGLTVQGVARGRSWIAFSGSAAQIETAFQTELHQYSVNGVTHYANATEPSVPAAFGSVVRAIEGLNDFRMKPLLRTPRQQAKALEPRYTSSKGSHYLAPDDFALIYNVKPLYDAGIDGSGQSIAVVGQTQINISDIQQFRSKFNLPAKDPQLVLVPGSRNPGQNTDEMAEADLDLEWSGAVARNANLIYVYSYSVLDAVQYAIDQKLAPILSSSYGACEAETPTSQLADMQSWAKQGNAEGMTWFAASGDAGGADCSDSHNPGLGVDAPASIPEVTGLGGTEFIEGSGNYWNAANNGNGASATSYIPETSWNDSANDGTPSASGGGASSFFLKPSWQTGSGVPGDNARHVPDVSLNASADHDGYMVYTSGATKVYGGTSVPAPAFAGVAALLSQYLQSSAGLGNINPNLYALAQSAPGAFHDITTGDNIVTVACSGRAAICATSPVGFSAGPGYDQVTGLGSVDVANLANAWNSSGPMLRPSDDISLIATPSDLPSNAVVFLTATVVGAKGDTPAGNVTFTLSGQTLGSAALVGSGGSATATLAVQGSQLPLGSANIEAEYNGTGASSPLTASFAVVVTQSTFTGSAPNISAAVNAASYKSVFAPGMVLSVFGSQLAATTQSAGVVPLPFSMAGVAATINGVAAPLYYVSPGQINLQIPYEITNGSAELSINNNGRVTSSRVTIASAGPGIFTDAGGAAVPSTSVTRGQAATLYITGYGTASPQIATGAAPASSVATASLPRPAQNVTVLVGGVPARVEFIAITWGLVGVAQINYQVPQGVLPGQQSVIVTVGQTASAPARVAVY